MIKKSNPYSGTKVWLASLSIHNDLILSQKKIPLWVGNIIKNILGCERWFAYQSIIINQSTYTLTYDMNELGKKSIVMIAKIDNNRFVDLNQCEIDLLEYVKNEVLERKINIEK